MENFVLCAMITSFRIGSESTEVFTRLTAQKWSFSLRIFSVNVRFLWIWSHLPKKSLMENLIFCAVTLDIHKTFMWRPRHHMSVKEFYQRLFSRGIFWQNSKQSLFRTLSIIALNRLLCFLAFWYYSRSLGWSGYLLVLTQLSKVDIVVQKTRSNLK